MSITGKWLNCYICTVEFPTMVKKERKQKKMMLQITFNWHGRIFTKYYVLKASLQCGKCDPIKDICQGSSKVHPLPGKASVSTMIQQTSCPGQGRQVPHTGSLCLPGPREPINHAELFAFESSSCLGLEISPLSTVIINAAADNNNRPLIGAPTLHPLALTLRNLLWSYYYPHLTYEDTQGSER